MLQNTILNFCCSFIYLENKLIFRNAVRRDKLLEHQFHPGLLLLLPGFPEPFRRALRQKSDDESRKQTREEENEKR